MTVHTNVPNLYIVVANQNGISDSLAILKHIKELHFLLVKVKCIIVASSGNTEGLMARIPKVIRCLHSD